MIKGFALWKYIDDRDYIIIEWTVLCLLHINSIKHNWMKASSRVNHATDETGTQRPLISKGKHNWLGFHPEIKVFSIWISSQLPPEKQRTNLSKPTMYKLFWKWKVYGSKNSKPKSHVSRLRHTGIFRIYLPAII